MYLEMLKRSKLFQGLSEEQIEEFLQNVDYIIKEYSAKALVTIQPGKTIFVLDGVIYTMENNSDGSGRRINTFTPENNVFIPMSTKEGYDTISIIAKKKSVLLYLDTESFTQIRMGILELQNKVQQNVIKLYMELFQGILERSMADSETTARKCVIKYIRMQQNKYNSNIIELNVTKEELADMLKIDISTLMRELRGLKKEGMIEYDRKSIKILKELY